MSNRTTELLCKLLEERGIEYAESQDRFRTRFRFNYCEACGDYLNEIEVMGACITASKSYLTPEQAIAATLGSDTKGCENLLWELVGALDVANATDASKKPIVTEYARRIAATLGSESVDYMLNTIGKLEEENERLRSSCGTLTAEQVSKAVYAHSIHADCADADWQAIADELNATVGADDGSRWAELFGTPERAAETLQKAIGECDGYGLHCSDCHFYLAPICPHCAGVKKAVDYDELNEWLRGKAVD